MDCSLCVAHVQYFEVLQRWQLSIQIKEEETFSSGDEIGFFLNIFYSFTLIEIIPVDCHSESMFAGWQVAVFVAAMFQVCCATNPEIVNQSNG